MLFSCFFKLFFATENNTYVDTRDSPSVRPCYYPSICLYFASENIFSDVRKGDSACTEKIGFRILIASCKFMQHIVFSSNYICVHYFD